jgi:uncharacterized membrane protein YhaH (DUF805 family)
LNSPQRPGSDPSINFRLLWVFTSVNGRIGRQVYWLAWIFVDCVAAIVLAGFIQVVADPETGRMMIEPPPRNITALIMAVSLPFFIVISVKRLHDLNASGLFAIALLFPPASIVATILLGILPAKPGPNRFGEAADVPPVQTAGS